MPKKKEVMKKECRKAALDQPGDFGQTGNIS